MGRLIAAMVVGLVLALPASAQPTPPEYQRDPVKGCLIWNPYSDQTASWSGGCKDGYADGPGTTTWHRNGQLDSVNTNTLVRGRPHGLMILNKATGDVYEMTFNNGAVHGPVTYRFKSGAIKTGAFVNDQRQGTFVTRWPDGTRLEEDYQQGRVVSARQAWTDGANYSGAWANGQPNGVGTYRTANGQVYSGQWNNGCFRQGDRWAYLNTTKEECGFK